MDLKLKGTIKTVNTLRDSKGHAFGETEFSKNAFIIRIALDKNKDVDEFCGTVLHELLHVWFKIIALVGVKVRSGDEHEVIKAIEGVVMYFVHLHLSRRK